MNIAVISRHPAPYRDPLLRGLAQDGRISVEIFNELPVDVGHQYWNISECGYEAVPLFENNSCHVYRFLSLIRRFVFGKYNFVLWAGFNSLDLTLAMFLAALFRRNFGFMADTMQDNTTNRFKRWIKGFIALRADVIFVPGDAGMRYWVQNYNVSCSKIVQGVYALDGTAIANDVNNLRLGRACLRSKYGISESDKVFLMVANMIPKRCYPITVGGFLRFVKNHGGCRFVIVGNGPDFVPMRELSKDHEELIVCPGCSFDEMKSFYAIADVYVHGGSEPASTALMIGAISGLPLISSDDVGCSADVLIDGASGIKVQDYHSSDDWCAAFAAMYEQQERWGEMGQEAEKLARKLDVSEVLRTLVEKLLAFE